MFSERSIVAMHLPCCPGKRGGTLRKLFTKPAKRPDGGQKSGKVFGRHISIAPKESLPAGSLIGGLRIIGDPARDIRVRLESGEDLPVAVEPGTKAWLPDGYSQIFISYVFGPSGSATLCCKI